MALQTSLLLLFSFLLLASCQLDYSTGGPCMDDPTTDCKDYAALCKNPMYQNFLDVFCPATCGLCPGSATVPPPPTAAPNCVDNNMNCKQWVKEGYCTACFVDCADRVKNCAKSCNFCVPGSCLNCKPKSKFDRVLDFQ